MSLVPEKGTVGASGDLAPLSHLALGLMGEGLMWSPSSGWAKAADVCLHTHTHTPSCVTPLIITRVKYITQDRGSSVSKLHVFLDLPGYPLLLQCFALVQP